MFAFAVDLNVFGIYNILNLLFISIYPRAIENATVWSIAEFAAVNAPFAYMEEEFATSNPEFA